MTQWTVRDRVLTPDRGVGIVKSVWPGSRATGTPAHYAVEVDGSRVAIVYTEGELRPALPADPASSVKCADCAQGGKSRFAPNAIRCRVFQQTRSGGALRECSHFIPLKPKEA